MCDVNVGNFTEHLKFYNIQLNLVECLLSLSFNRVYTNWTWTHFKLKDALNVTLNSKRNKKIMKTYREKFPLKMLDFIKFSKCPPEWAQC